MQLIPRYIGESIHLQVTSRGRHDWLFHLGVIVGVSQWRSQDFLMGGFSAGKSGNRGAGEGEGAGGGLPPPARGPGAGPRAGGGNAIFQIADAFSGGFRALFRQYQNSDKPALCL